MEDHQQELADTINFTASEFALGRQRRRKWVSLITQQLRLRHVYQIYAFNLSEDRQSIFYFTLHNTPLSSPFYTSEKVPGKHPKWNELLYGSFIETNVSSVVIRIWKSTKEGDEIILTWGVNFSGLVYLGNKIADLQSKFFKANTVIFFMQGVYFTSQDYIRNDLDKPLPFQKNLNLFETSRGEQVLYKRVAVKVPKGEVTSSYTLEKLRRLQELQRQIKNTKSNVAIVKEKIKSATERQTKEDVHNYTSSNNIRFAPQLLTMNHLNKMLHEKPTKEQRVTMTKVSKKIEVLRYRVRVLHQERDRKMGNGRRLKQKEVALGEENEEKNFTLMAMYHSLSKESQQWDEYRHSLLRKRDILMVVGEQLRVRQSELLKELLFIYPIDKMTNELKYTILGIHLPDSEVLLDYQDPGVSAVLGYICHILIMCSIFLQVPLRHPMKHLGSRSVIYNQVYPEIPDKEREFPLYTKGKDRAHFSYAVFLLNKNISQLRWYLHHKLTIDLKETLKHLRSLLLGDDVPDARQMMFWHLSHQDKRSRPPLSDASTNTVTADSSGASLEKLVSPSLSSINDPLLDRIHDELKKEHQQHFAISSTTSPKKKIGIFKPSTPKKIKKEKMSKSASEVFALPEAYLNRRISKEAFHRCALEGYSCEEKPGDQENEIKVRQGVEECQSKGGLNLGHSDSIEEGTDPLDPSTTVESLTTKSIDIIQPSRAHDDDRRVPGENNRISRSMDSYVGELASSFNSACALGSDSAIPAACDRSGINGGLGEGGGRSESEQRLLKQLLLTGDSSLLSSTDSMFPEECLRISLQGIASPLTERTERLLSTNQSFNFVKHRPVE